MVPRSFARRPRPASLSAAGLALLALSAPAALAQTLRLPDPANTTVDQSSEEYTPLGITAGTFIIHPRLRTGFELNDNVYARDSDKDQDAGISIAPDITATSQVPDRFITLQAGGEIGRWASESENNFEDFYARGAAISNIFEQDRFGVSGGVTRYHEDRTSADQEAFRKLTTITSTGGQLTYHKGLDRLFLETALSGQYLKYDNPSENESDRDRFVGAGEVRAGYQVSPRIAAYGVTSLKRTQYAHTENDEGIKRSSTTWFGGVGTDLDITGLLFGSANAGFVYRKYEDTSLDEVTGIESNVGLTWNPTELTSVILRGRTSLEETTLTVGDDTASTDSVKEINLRLVHSLQPNLFLTAGTRYARDDYVDTSRSDNTLEFTLGAKWLMTRNLAYDAGYTLTKRSSNADNADFIRNVFLTGLTLTF